MEWPCPVCNRPVTPETRYGRSRKCKPCFRAETNANHAARRAAAKDADRWLCPTCRTETGPHDRYGTDRICKTCKKLTVRAYQIALRGSAEGLERRREQARTANRKAKYGVSREQYQQLVEAQGGRCAICRCPARLVIDHNHSCCAGSKTCGVCIRGLLCKPCNQGLGFFRDDPFLLSAAADYLSASIVVERPPTP